MSLVVMASIATIISCGIAIIEGVYIFNNFIPKILVSKPYLAGSIDDLALRLELVNPSNTTLQIDKAEINDIKIGLLHVRKIKNEVTGQPVSFIPPKSPMRLNIFFTEPSPIRQNKDKLGSSSVFTLIFHLSNHRMFRRVEAKFNVDIPST